MSQPARSISHDVYAYTHSLSSPPSLTPLTALIATHTHAHTLTHTHTHTHKHTHTCTQRAHTQTARILTHIAWMHAHTLAHTHTHTRMHANAITAYKVTE